jgi:hypothetical protein
MGGGGERGGIGEGTRAPLGGGGGVKGRLVPDAPRAERLVSAQPNGWIQPNGWNQPFSAQSNRLIVDIQRALHSVE